MDVKEIINTLKIMDNQCFNSTILPWQMLEICRAKLLDKNTVPTKEKLTQYAKNLNPIDKGICVENAEYFCFLPSSQKKWKVYLVDRFNRVLGQLEDYEDEIKEKETGNEKDTPFREAFLIELK